MPFTKQYSVARAFRMYSKHFSNYDLNIRSDIKCILQYHLNAFIVDINVVWSAAQNAQYLSS